MPGKSEIDRKKSQFFSELSSYATTYEPFIWDTVKNDFRLEYKGKNDLIVSFYRYSKIMFEIFKRWKSNSTVMDFGIFPGVIQKLFYDFFPKTNYKCYGTGLMFSPEFVKGMKQINVELLETELDPAYFLPKKVNPIPWINFDFVLFLDIIEHLTNPIFALDTANRCLKKGGYLILTTDNITNSDNVISILRGKTPLPHPILTNMFYMGEWRPHFREYSKEDLLWILQHCGFSIESHEYFDRKQGEYINKNGCLALNHNFVECASGDNKNIYKKTKKKAKRWLYRLLRTLLSCRSHFLNHQIVVATKTYETEELIGKRPEMQYTSEDWLKIREKYLGH